MRTKKYLSIIAGILLILGLMFFVWMHPSDAPSVIYAQLPKPMARTPRSSSDGKIVDSRPEPGVITVPEFGEIQYSKHRIIRVSQLIKAFCDEHELRQFMNESPSAALDVYEDEKGYLVFLSHNLGHYRSMHRDTEAIESMKKSGVNISFKKIQKFRMDDDFFLKALVSKFRGGGYLSWDARGNHPPEIFEFMIFPIAVKLDGNYGGNEEKGVEFPALMVRQCEGNPNDFYYEDPYKPEDLYLRSWNIAKYGDDKFSESGKGFIGLVSETLVELRMDLPTPPQKFSGTHRFIDDHGFTRPNQGKPPAPVQEK